jgi:hypothetical protein
MLPLSKDYKPKDLYSSYVYRYDKVIKMDNNQKLEDVLALVDTRVGKELAEKGLMEERDGKYHSLTEGVCYTFWDRKKEILKREYGIEWQSPPDLDPTVLYD